MEEITSKRSYNAKIFNNNDGSNTLNYHIGHIHYFNKLGVGDGEKRYREIDWKLQWDNKRRGWYFEYHNFQPFIPEYADSWIEFRDLFQDKDQAIKYKPVCEHIKGRLIDPEDVGLGDYTSVNCVIYDDAFEKGKDLIIYFYRSSLAKVIRIRNDFKGSKDLSFDFELELPKVDNKTVDVYRSVNKDELSKELNETIFNETNNVYKLDLSENKTFDSPKQTLIGNEKKDGKEWFTYLNTYKAWDSGSIDNYHEQVISVDFIKDNNKLILRKNISLEFIELSVGDIFTDTTTSYYSGGGDGYTADSDNATWATVRGGTGAESTTGYQMAFSGVNSSNIYRIRRNMHPYFLSSLPSFTSITSATVYQYVYAIVDDLNDSYGYLDLEQSSQASISSIANGDYDGITLNSPTKLASDVDITNISVNAWLSRALNSTGIALITAGGSLKLADRCGRDVANQAPSKTSQEKRNYVQCRSSAYTGTDYDPYISIVYTPTAPTTSIKTINGLAYASIKTVNGLAIASVKTWNGLA